MSVGFASGAFGCQAGAEESLSPLRKCLISLKVFFPSLLRSTCLKSAAYTLSSLSVSSCFTWSDQTVYSGSLIL